MKSGNHPFQVGDSKSIDLGEELGTHTIRLSNTTPCEGLNLASQTACGFVLEFADIIETHEMNDVVTNAGGWPATKMRIYVNETIYESIPKDLKNEIIDTYVVSGHGSGDTTGELDNDNFGSTDKLYLLSATELTGNSSLSTAGDSTRQLGYYINNGYVKNGIVRFWTLRTTL